MPTLTDQQQLAKFADFVDEIIPQQLFHVSVTDLAPNGARLDETILLNLLASYPDALKHKPLAWFVDTFITKAQ